MYAIQYYNFTTRDSARMLLTRLSFSRHNFKSRSVNNLAQRRSLAVYISQAIHIRLTPPSSPIIPSQLAQATPITANVHLAPQSIQGV